MQKTESMKTYLKPLAYEGLGVLQSDYDECVYLSYVYTA